MTMRRFLCTILAIAMVMAMIPAVFAEGETEVTTRTYTFSATATGVTAGSTGAVSIDSFDKNKKDNGWLYIDVNNEAENTGDYHIYQLHTNDLRVFANRTPIALPKGVQLALALEKPSLDPGFYKATVSPANTPGTNMQFHIGKWDNNKNSVETYMKEGKTDFSSVLLSSGIEKELDGIVYNDGINDFAFVIDTMGQNNLYLASLRLDELSSPEIALSLDKTTLGVGETATASVDVTSEQVTQKLLNEYVTYESDNEAVAKVSELGEITGLSTGTATITATVGGETYTQKINVVDLSGIKVEYDTYVGSNSTAASANLITYELWTSNGRVEYFTTTSTDELPAIWDQKMKEVEPKTYRFVAALELKPNSEEYTAYKIRVPLAGDYMTSLYYLAGQNTSRGTSTAKSGSMYILPYTANMDIAGAISTATPVLSNINFYDETNQFKTTEEVIFSAPVAGEYLMVWKNTGTEGTAITPVKLTLNGGDGKAPIWANMSVENSELEVDGTTTLTSTVYTSDGKAATDTTGITYTSTNNAVATVANGTVTAVGAGAAKIQAKNGDYVLGEVDVTVTAPAVEPEAAPTEISYGQYDNVNGKVSVNEAAPGTELTFTAEEIAGYTFRYWVLGSAATGRYYSSESTVVVKPYANIALTAIYTKTDDGSKVVDLFNYNGEFLQTLTSLNELANVKPTMIGHTFADKWLINETTELTAQTTLTAPVTQAVAQYTKNPGYEAENANNDSAYGWTRNGKLVTYDEDYTFLTWLNEVGTIERNAVEITDKIPLALLESNGSAYMLEYDKGDYTIVEAGILFGKNAEPEVDSAYSKAKVKNIKAHGQFTASPMDTETTARGYIIYEDNGEYKVIYVD